MTAESFYTDRAFFAPAFRIKLNGQDTGREVIADVLELSFSDDLENIDSFEFVLHDWDAAQRRPKYSSPWDENGQLLALSAGGPTVPVFEPGAKVSLFMGYTEEGELPLIMEGEVISLTPSFPASGAPTCRVRALDAFQRGLQKIHVEGNYSGTAKAIVDQLCQNNDVTVQWSTVEEEGSEQQDLDIEGILYEEIQKRAKDYGLSMMTVPPEAEGEAPTLFLALPKEDASPPVADFVWGRTLISFSPVLSAKGQVAEVVCRAGDPNADGDGRIEVTKTWADIGLSPSALGPAGSADIDTAVAGLREIIKPDNVRTEEDANRAALAHLTEMATTLITGSGSAVGLPTLRAGKTVTIAGLGARFDGLWRLTQTTHSIGAGGYTTSFQARKEVLDG
jgi:Bacteriophage probable baseplate hub protein